MKISGELSAAHLEAYNNNLRNRDAAAPPLQRANEESGLRTETVIFSATARELQKIRNMLEATPEIRKDRVEQCKREIAAGIYSKSADDIAGKIIRESLFEGCA